MSAARSIVTIVIGVLAFALILGWGVWWAWRSGERAERDPRYLRRRFIRFAVIYIVYGLFIIGDVAFGKAPIETLGGLPMGALIIWFCLWTARKVKNPPDA